LADLIGYWGQVVKEKVKMAIVCLTIEVQGGVATVTDVKMPGLTLRIRLRDYDIDGSDPDDLDTDEDGRPYTESVIEYPGSPEPGGFV
jgi:hypothetical protein